MVEKFTLTTKNFLTTNQEIILSLSKIVLFRNPYTDENLPTAKSSAESLQLPCLQLVHNFLWRFLSSLHMATTGLGFDFCQKRNRLKDFDWRNELLEKNGIITFLA